MTPKSQNTKPFSEILWKPRHVIYWIRFFIRFPAISVLFLQVMKYWVCDIVTCSWPFLVSRVSHLDRRSAESIVPAGSMILMSYSSWRQELEQSRMWTILLTQNVMIIFSRRFPETSGSWLNRPWRSSSRPSKVERTQNSRGRSPFTKSSPEWTTRFPSTSSLPTSWSNWSRLTACSHFHRFHPHQVL